MSHPRPNRRNGLMRHKRALPGMVDRAHPHNQNSNETRMSFAKFKADAAGKLMHPMAENLTDQQAIDNFIAYSPEPGYPVRPF